jgi:TPR repeat protein
VLAAVLERLSRRSEALGVAHRALGLSRDDEDRREAQRLIDRLGHLPAAAPTPAEAAAGGSTGAGAAASPLAARFFACASGDRVACAEVMPRLEKACQEGDGAACVRAALVQAKVPREAGDEAKGRATLERLCGESRLDACTALALVHAAKGTPADFARARALLDKACLGGIADACRVRDSLAR